MEFNDLTEEQKAKALACESPEELLALAREEGMELTDEQLEGVAGGWGSATCGDRTAQPCDKYTITTCH